MFDKFFLLVIGDIVQVGIYLKFRVKIFARLHSNFLWLYQVLSVAITVAASRKWDFTVTITGGLQYTRLECGFVIRICIYSQAQVFPGKVPIDKAEKARGLRATGGESPTGNNLLIAKQLAIWSNTSEKKLIRLKIVYAPDEMKKTDQILWITISFTKLLICSS